MYKKRKKKDFVEKVKNSLYFPTIVNILSETNFF